MLWPKASPLDLDFGLCAWAKLFKIGPGGLRADHLPTELPQANLEESMISPLSHLLCSVSEFLKKLGLVVEDCIVLLYL